MARRKRQHPSLDMRMREDVAEDVRLCEWPGCVHAAAHKAPRSRESLREYRWFCLEHVRTYNKSWNFFEGMNDAQVEAALRRDTVWDRPTWPLSGADDRARRGPKMGAGPLGIDPDYFIDDFGLFTEDRTRPSDGPLHPEPATRAALALFGLQLPLTGQILKAKYKELVKKHHPDANGGTKEAEEKFKEICAAYETLRTFLVV